MADAKEILCMRVATILIGKSTSTGLGQADSVASRWMQQVSERIGILTKGGQANGDEHIYQSLHKIGIAALDSFLQSNVTGPPLCWNSAEVLFPPDIAKDPWKLHSIRQTIIQDLSVDGEAVYLLAPNIELFALAKCILNHPASIGSEKVLGYQDFRWSRVTVNFWHQKLLSENAASLQQIIYDDLDLLAKDHRNRKAEETPRRLVQRATIHTQHGFDHRARVDLQCATEKTGLEFELTGRLGKRTKFQENALSQLVVLAKSKDRGGIDNAQGTTMQSYGTNETSRDATNKSTTPEDLNLNDDTLLESIVFSKSASDPSSMKESDRSASLAALDPANQPTLEPLDSIILLAYASSITNTSPSDGLTREGTLPYATRVLQGKSTNWQIFTQALLVRSRIEGYRSRTVERGVLQLQALVDQVIVETTPTVPSTQLPTPEIQLQDDSGTSSFLPKPKPSESAPAEERLAYIHQLASPTRWELEAELASRWVSLGGLRTALEIYERLQMWAEVAMCWAANDREDKARKIIRRLLYTPAQPSAQELQHTQPSIDDDNEDEDQIDVDDLTQERIPHPPDAPRLFCILGDMERSPSAYEKAWEVSNHRYARAQRSLGKYYFGRGDLQKSDEAYVKSLKVNALNHSTWFSLGCVRLQTENWTGAVDAFSRAVQIEDTDAESWSNMAAALMQLPPDVNIIAAETPEPTESDDEDPSTTLKQEPPKHMHSAFTALKRAAALKRDSYRIWQNLLNVAVKISPPPYTDIIIAQTRVIDLCGKIDGEKCIDVEVMEGLLAHLIATTPSPPSAPPPTTDTPTPVTAPSGRDPAFEKMLHTLLQDKITPLITTSPRLHLLLATFSLHLHHPAAALDAYEKAWRCALNTPGWEHEDDEGKWMDVVDATVQLVDAYEKLGEGRAARFKAKTAVRSVLGRGRERWAGSEGFEGLERRMEELRGG
ncbi:MAG: hypothetical protein Q9182_005490 [Xanthomendoza sp. 2 TL-2023]